MINGIPALPNDPGFLAFLSSIFVYQQNIDPITEADMLLVYQTIGEVALTDLIGGEIIILNFDPCTCRGAELAQGLPLIQSAISYAAGNIIGPVLVGGFSSDCCC